MVKKPEPMAESAEPAAPLKMPPMKCTTVSTTATNHESCPAPRPIDKQDAVMKEASRSAGGMSKPSKMYQEIDEESGDLGNKYQEVIAKSSHPWKMIKMPALITEEMDEDSEGGDMVVEQKQIKKKKARVVEEEEDADAHEKIEWSTADKHQAKVDALWKNQDEEDLLVQLQKLQKGVTPNLHVGPFYWGSYTAPVEDPMPITFK